MTAGRVSDDYNAADVRRWKPPRPRGAVPARVSPRHDSAPLRRMSAAVFYVLAVLVVAAALFAVVVPSTRLLLLGVVATDVVVGALLIAAGAQLLGAIAVLAPALCLGVVTVLLHRAGYRELLVDVPGLAKGWPGAIAGSVAVGVLLVWTAASSVDDSSNGGSTASLLTILHYRTPVSLGVAIVITVTAVAGALLIGRTGEDERHRDRAAEARRLRDERAAARREHRAAARAQRTSRTGGSR